MIGLDCWFVGSLKNNKRQQKTNNSGNTHTSDTRRGVGLGHFLLWVIVGFAIVVVVFAFIIFVCPIAIYSAVAFVEE